MKIYLYFFFSFATFSLVATTQAMNVKYEPSSSSSSFTFSQLDLPRQELQRDFQSGLPCKLTYQMQKQNSKGEKSHDFLLVVIRYDLWEEKYLVDKIQQGQKISLSIKKEEEFWKELNEVLIAATGPLEKNNYYSVDLIVTLNPISRERMQELQKWMNETSLPMSSNEGRPLGLTVNRNFIGSTFQKFLKVYVDNAKDENLVGKWSKVYPTQKVLVQ